MREIVSADGVKKAEVQWTLRGLRSDAAVVVVASGPGVTQPYWDLPRPYQATSTHHVSRVLSLNNPVFVDVDGDGRFTAPFARAQAIADKHGKDEAKAWTTIWFLTSRTPSTSRANRSATFISVLFFAKPLSTTLPFMVSTVMLAALMCEFPMNLLLISVVMALSPT